MRLQRTIFVLLASMFVFGCTPAPQVDLDAERASLTAVAEAYHVAGATMDTETLLALYAENSRIIAPDQAEVLGLEAIEEWMMGLLEMSNFEATFESPTVEVSITGGYGYSLANATMSFDGPDGERITEHVRDLHVWEKISDGSWKVLVDIWNSPPEITSQDL